MVRFNSNHIVAGAVGLVAVGVLVLGFGADASGAFAKYVGRCASNLEFYEKHMAWCERAYTVADRIAPRMARHARAVAHERTYAAPSGGQQVTVYRDHQAADDGGHVPDKFIALQTPANVAAGQPSFFGFALGAWFPGALDLGTNTITTQPVLAQAPRPRVTTTYYVKKVVAQQ